MNLANQLPRCPRCEARLLAQLDKRRLWCQSCGYERTDQEALAILQEYAAMGGRDLLEPDLPTYDHESRPNESERAFLRRAWEAYKVKDYKSTRYICDSLLKENHRLIDAYWMLFLTAGDVNEKARHLASVLTFMPTHKQALRELDKLRPIVGEKVRPSFFTAAEYGEKVEEVQAKGHLEDCPNCGGRTLYVEGDTVKCLHCGYIPDAATKSQILNRRDALVIEMPTHQGYKNLRDALIDRKYGASRDWQIAKRVLSCENCGAQLTLSGNMMTQQCAFCDSQHILYKDSVGSFQEPDGILPADLNEEAALKIYYTSLPDSVRKLVVRHESVGVFLPYWSFKTLVGVNEIGLEGTYELENILVPVAKEPNQKIIEDIQPYDLTHLRPYDQRYLASWSAQLYSTDAIQASITATAYAKWAAIRAELGYNFENGMLARSDISYKVAGYSLRDHAVLLDEIWFRFLLLPVWMFTLHLEGDGYYHAIVNAQTGEVIITERVDSKTTYRTRGDRGVPQPAFANAHQSTVIKPLTAPPPKKESIIKPLRPRA